MQLISICSDRRIPALLTTLLTALGWSPAIAGNWEWGSRFDISALWNQNPALAIDEQNPRTTFRFLASYDGEFSRLAANNTFAITPRITRDYYPDKEFRRLESTNIFLPANFSWFRPRTNYGLGLNVSRQNILSDEGTLADGTNVNFLNADDTLTRASIVPSFSWTLTTRDQILLTASAAISDFELDFTNRADSKTASAQFTYLRSVTQTQSLGFTASASRFDSENLSFFSFPLPTDPPTFQTIRGKVENQSDSQSLTLDYNFDLSSRTRFTLKFGLQDTTSSNTIIDTETGQQLAINDFPFESTTYNLGVVRSLETGEYRVALGRTVTPAANGQPQDRYQLEFTGNVRHSEKLSGRWRFLASEQQNIILSSTAGQFSRKNRFFSGEYIISWSLSQKWRLNGSYQYRYRDQDAAINDPRSFTASSNQISVGLNYIWKTFDSTAKPIPDNRR